MRGHGELWQARDEHELEARSLLGGGQGPEDQRGCGGKEKGAWPRQQRTAAGTVGASEGRQPESPSTKTNTS